MILKINIKNKAYYKIKSQIGRDKKRWQYLHFWKANKKNNRDNLNCKNSLYRVEIHQISTKSLMRKINFLPVLIKDLWKRRKIVRMKEIKKNSNRNVNNHLLKRWLNNKKVKKKRRSHNLKKKSNKKNSQ